MANAKRQPAWKTELDDLMRAVAGAFLFGAPFLYTMEVWWKGNFTSPPRMLLLLGIAYAALILLNLQGGFRGERSKTRMRVMTDSLEALAIALLSATLSLILIGVIHLDTGLEAAMGRVINEALPFSLGVGIADNVLHPDDDTASEPDWQDQTWRGTFADAGATALGAIVVSASIAPTDEIPMISSMISVPWLLIIIAASLLLSYLIVFQASFGAQNSRRSQPGFFQSPISETLASYLISLLISVLMLWIFQLVRLEDPGVQWVSYTVILGFPATIGGAAGRLAL
ncbi:MAG: TIGR02587 family membrane protein [Drouetiella hepatica Uher 2000/2452]|jgi:putative integral membrane protein (TIGR02587 family)|uniref:TIGR02587 family membrane protein n=1 Tax=Drouetiella hepatica Uher 2000/2452 TaxID=904376 RepID=A0A951QF84_9CYAN|nr:TIGR02587 family membrane protein [Drouetiella hepatica Uher 2000/2452]